jgi:hypothetical protein
VNRLDLIGLKGTDNFFYCLILSFSDSSDVINNILLPSSSFIYV